MYVDVWKRSEMCRNLKSVQGFSLTYVDMTNLNKPACIVNFWRNLGDVLENISV